MLAPLLLSLLFLSGIGRAGDLPLSIETLRQAGPLCIDLRTDTGRDVHLEWDTFYSTQTFGTRLTTEQIEKLDILRVEAPEKFQMLARLFPQQLAEYFLRTNLHAATPAETAMADRQFLFEVAPSALPAAGAERPRSLRVERTQTPGFDSPRKAAVFFALQKEYSPFRSIGMSMVGDTLSIDGKIVTETLRADAAAAGMSVEQFADARHGQACRALAQMREGQLTNIAYAKTILGFLKDPRLTAFTPDEVQTVFRCIFRRDLKGVADEAERAASRLEPQQVSDLRQTLARR